MRINGDKKVQKDMDRYNFASVWRSVRAYDIHILLSLFILFIIFYGYITITEIHSAQKRISDKIDSLEIRINRITEQDKTFSERYDNNAREIVEHKNSINKLEKNIREINKRIKYRNSMTRESQADNLPIPQNVWAEYAEKNLVINWDPVKGAVGYNVYRSAVANAAKSEMEQLNQRLITSDNRFVFIWRFTNGKRERMLKGYRHYISITAVFNQQGVKVESGLSQTVSNSYFDGFSNMTSERRIENILLDEQKSAYLPTIYGSNDKYSFIKFMSGPGQYLTKLLRDSLDFQEVGACDPVSTIALKLLSDWGLYALRAEGVFIEEYHTFIVLKVANVEYILDFTGDQFVPDVSPVMVPRDLCYINKQGQLDSAGKPIYLIEKVYPAESFELNNTKKSRVYHNIYRTVYNAYIDLVPIQQMGELEIIR
jgi:uncharacterized coiled-coil protein SlyX